MSSDFTLLKGSGLNSLFYKGLVELKNSGSIDKSRYGETLELLNVTLLSTEPKNRVLNLKYRKNDFIAQLAETIWFLSRRKEIIYLQPFLPRAIEFSDDGTSWRSAYGPRMRNYPSDEPNGVDQLLRVVNILYESLNSRRAFINLTYPPVDLTPGKDITCNTFISFLVRENKLNMTVTNRSNDIYWGYSGINYFEFTVLQEILASCLNISTGTYVHNSQNFHIYNHHWDKMNAIISCNSEESMPEFYHLPIIIIDNWYNTPEIKLYLIDKMISDYIYLLDYAVNPEISNFDKDLFLTKITALFHFYKDKSSFIYYLIPPLLKLAIIKKFNEKSEVMTVLESFYSTSFTLPNSDCIEIEKTDFYKSLIYSFNKI